MKKRRGNKGESLIETMLSLLVIALGLAMLAGAIVKSSKLNDKSAWENAMPFMSVVSGDAFPDSNVTLTLSDTGNSSGAIVTCYRVQSANGEMSLEYYK